MSGDTGFEMTARVQRVRLEPIAKAILGRLTDAVIVDKASGRVTYPDWSIAEIAERTGYSISTVQRRLKMLELLKLVRRLVRTGRSYVFQPLVNQLPLSLAEAEQQAPLLPDTRARAGVTELQAHPASTWSKRGAQGRFVPVEDFHSFGQPDRSSVEILTDRSVSLTDPPGLNFGGGSVSVTDHIGQPDRSDRSARPILDGTIGSTNNKQQIRTESAAAAAAGLPLMGIPLTPEQRQALSRAPADDSNFAVLKALALCLGRDPLEARKYALVAIESEGDLREATKTAAAQSPGIRYDLTTKDGEGVLHLAVKVAWAILRREGVVREKPLEMPSARRRRSGRGT